jgi:hypothetical protein
VQFKVHRSTRSEFLFEEMLNEETFQGFGAGLPDFKTKVPIWVNV